MKSRRYVLDLMKTTAIFNFNVVNRDQWVSQQARQIPAGSKVLDAGAGSCPYRGFFSHCEYRSQDFVSLGGEQLSGGQYGEIDYVCDILSIPVNDASFDVILCSEVLEHLPDPVKALYEFSRILKPGGKIILTAPLGSGIHQEPYHFYGGYTPFWYEKYLGEAGFETIVIEENAGSIRACAQESIRFIQLSQPFKMALPIWGKLLWMPIWLLLLPVLAIIVPISSTVLNNYDRDKRFTVGYHVTAVRKESVQSER